MVGLFYQPRMIDEYGTVGGMRVVRGIKVKGEVVPALNQISTMPCRRMGKWRCSSTFLYHGTRWR
jgi:hypothetical protein